jgi:hypothetical protein
MWNSCINTKIYFWWRSWEDRAWNKEHSCLHKLCGGTEIGIFLSFLFILLGSVTSKVPVLWCCMHHRHSLCTVAFRNVLMYFALAFVILCIQINAWLADQDAEALRCQKLLVEEEEAAQRRCTLCSHFYIECVMLLCVLLLLQV